MIVADFAGDIALFFIDMVLSAGHYPPRVK